ncbi:MAG: gliding motility-associated ABC transporter ATP-binding subunit GldA [Bacteroidetes bacterium]|nr:MAG: gliding motility-associated ABC transporter ATP-binding subunit GldA [Bacteroidota bacterium]
MSIEITDVTKIYGSQKALDSVSFRIDQGEIVGFLGPNGAGKSTMMKIITSFLPQTSGQVSVCGNDVLLESMEVRRNVGYLPENNPLYYDMYVKEYLSFVAGMYKMKNSGPRVDEMIGLTGLVKEYKKKIGALSKGYKQRVGLAQALIHDPKVLILDEPTSGLDPNQLVEIRALITEIGKEKTVMLSTHIMQEVESVCDRIIIIKEGKIVADDGVDEIKKGAKELRTILVEFDKSISVEDLLKINGVDDTKDIGDNKWLVSTRETEDIRPVIFQFAVDNGLSVLTMNEQKQSLEDVFKELTS